MVLSASPAVVNARRIDIHCVGAVVRQVLHPSVPEQLLQQGEHVRRQVQEVECVVPLVPCFTIVVAAVFDACSQKDF